MTNPPTRPLAKFLCVLPHTEDPRQWNLTTFKGHVVAVHPEHQPIYLPVIVSFAPAPIDKEPSIA